MNKCILSNIQIENMRQQYVEGTTIKKLAETHEVNYSTLYGILKKKEKRVRRSFDIYSYNIIKIRKMREAGLTYRKIAQECNLSYSKVYSIINKNK